MTPAQLLQLDLLYRVFAKVGFAQWKLYFETEVGILETREIITLNEYVERYG